LLSRGASVAIYRLLQQSAFEPDDVERMASAYEQALIELGLADRNDPLTEVLAKLIVEVAQTGEKDSKTICARALNQLNNIEREAC
jgi:hypothetical protein